MALDCSPINLYDEIEAAERLRDAHIYCANGLVRSYVAQNYRRDWQTSDPQPENHAFEYISLMLGQLVANNPQVVVNSLIGGFQGLTLALADALNCWIRRERLQTTIEAIVLDACFAFGVGMVGFGYDPNTAADADGLRNMKPSLTHIPYWRFFTDPTSCHGIPPRYQGHTWFRDKDDLLADPKYDRKAVEELLVDADLDKISPEFESQRVPDRNQVVGFELWVPDAKTDGSDPNEHGMIYTLAATRVHQHVVSDEEKKKRGITSNGKMKAAFIRAPRPFWGPAEGPYRIFGGWPVPGGAYPLSPLAATKEQADELNAHVTAAARSAARMKDIVIVGADNSGLANAVKDTPHGHVVKVKGYVKGMFDEVHIGGPSAEQMAYIATARDRLDRNSGITDAQRGNLRQGVTATAENSAAQAATIRTETQSGFVRRAVGDCLRSVAWYMFHSEDFVAFLSPEASKKLNMAKAAFVGGPHQSTEDLRFEDLSLDIQPYSMERVDPVLVQGRVQQLLAQVVQIAQLAPQMPFFKFNEAIKQLAHAHNAPWITELIDEEVLAQILQAQSQPQQTPVDVLLKIYRDAPSDVKAQIEQALSLQPSQAWGMTPPADPNQPKQSGNPALMAGGMGMQQGNPHQAMIDRMMGRGGDEMGMGGMMGQMPQMAGPGVAA